MQLRPYRQRKNITLAALARRVRVSAAYLSQIESGLRKPSMDVFATLSVELELSDQEIGTLVRAVRA